MPIPPAQLLSAWLGRVSFDPNLDFPLEALAAVRYEVMPTVSISELQRDDGVQAQVTVRAGIDFLSAEDGVRLEGGDAALAPFALEVDVHGLFGWESDIVPADDALARGWLEYNGMYLLWPYLRAYITAITSYSHFPALTLYTMNVPSPPVIPANEEAAGTTEADAPASMSDKRAVS